MFKNLFTKKNSEMRELQKKLTKLAISVAKDFNIKLDFSHDSIRNVEKVLSQFHSEFIKTKNDQGLNGIALEFAAYIVTVIEKQTKEGEWARDHKKFGENSFPFYWKNKDIFPYAWCQKRIFNSEADNVWTKYQNLILTEI